MNRVITGTFLAASFAVGLSAQTTPPSSSPQTPTQTPSQTSPSMQESRGESKDVIVTGCLKAGDSADSYQLSDLKFKQDKDKAVGTTGAPPAAIASASSLKLIGAPTGTKLSEHVGHTVEVTGKVSDKAPSASPGAPSDPASTRPSAGASSTPALEVKSVKMVSATCTP
jgi:hypothetical protein